MSTTPSGPRHLTAAPRTDDSIRRERVAQTLGQFREATMHEQRTGRRAKHRAETAPTPLTAAIRDQLARSAS